ncbi:MAG: DPP IV N-terminal domain-containing protein [Planctomycetota bacterium]
MLVVVASVGDASARATGAPEVYGYKLRLNWFDGNERCWYRIDRRGGRREFVVVDARNGSRKPCFDHSEVVGRIKKAGGDRVDLVEHIEYSTDGKTIQLATLDGVWLLDLATQEVRRLPNGDASLPRLEPLERLTRSRGQGIDTHITFANQTKGDVVVEWVNVSREAVRYFTLPAGESRRQHTHARHVWRVLSGERSAVFRAEEFDAVAVIDEISLQRRQAESSATPVPGAASPGGRWGAFVRDHNLWLRDTADGSESRVSVAGTEASSFRKSAQRRRAISLVYDQPDYPGPMPEVYWSPDSRYAIAVRTDVVDEPTMTLVDSRPARGRRPVAKRLPYLRPGDALPTPHLHLFDLEKRVEVPIRGVETPNAYKLSNFYWSRDSKTFFFVYNQRGHEVLQLIGVDAATGDAGVVVDERSPTFVDYSRKLAARHLPATDEVVWMSERSGWNHLYLYDRAGGEVVRPLTSGEWVVKSIAHFDKSARVLWVIARGFVPGQDPSYEHLLRVTLDGADPLQLTRGDGFHEVSFSPDKRFFLDSWSRVDLPPRHYLRRSSDGHLVCVLETADDSELVESGFRPPERFASLCRDGADEIHGIIHYPGDFDPSKHYPVIENIYASPSGQYVPKDFRWDYKHQREIADAGFVVVQIDGKGTNWRSRAFHDVAWKNLADSGFPDRIAWMKQASKTRPWMDLSRVGIYGGSAGGQNALRALIDHHDFYKVAVADCGCHDNRVDKLWWNEAWMGWPIGDAYGRSSNVDHAHRMSGKLLLSVGELDDNVDPASTYQVVDALRQAGKHYELLVFPGLGHAAIESSYGRQKRREFFERHLLNAANAP